MGKYTRARRAASYVYTDFGSHDGRTSRDDRRPVCASQARRLDRTSSFLYDWLYNHEAQYTGCVPDWSVLVATPYVRPCTNASAAASLPCITPH